MNIDNTPGHWQFYCQTGSALIVGKNFERLKYVLDSNLGLAIGFEPSSEANGQIRCLTEKFLRNNARGGG